MTYCSVYGCSNNSENSPTSKRPGRAFIRFHQCPKDPKKRAKWDKRLNRDLSKVSKGKPKAYHVCSEHFSDEDYVQADLLRVRMMGCSKNQKIHLKKDAQPNTDRESGLANYGANGQLQTSKQLKGPNKRYILFNN